MKSLKILFVTLFFGLVSSGPICASASNDSESKPITLTDPMHASNDNNANIPRMPAYIPLYVEYNGFLSCLTVNCKKSLGSMELVINNYTTGEYLSGTLSGEVGTQMVPISGTEGFYTITFTLQNGTQYYGEFEL